MCAFREFHEMYEYTTLLILTITFRLILTMKQKILTFLETTNTYISTNRIYSLT